MASHQPFTLYNPEIPREQNVMVPAGELKEKLTSFFMLYRPKQAAQKIDQLLEIARLHGVLALERIVKRKFNVSLDDADASEVGWTRILRKLEEYYAEYDQSKNIKWIFSYAREHGLFALDTKLKNKYGESLTEFIQRGLNSWKQNWNSFLKEHHSRSVSYELTRFYKFIESIDQVNHNVTPFKERVEWACNHSRLEVNEKLLKKYKFCLDDIKMVKGNTDEERKTNLKLQLVKFYQKYDPEKLGGRYQSSRTLEEAQESPEMIALDREAEWGYIHLEQLERRLKHQYNAGLLDNFSTELKRRLEIFYSSVGVEKSIESLDRIVDFAKKKGLPAVNEKLMLTYGRGISLEGL